MKPNAGESKAPDAKPSAPQESKVKSPEPKPGSKPDAKPDPKDDLKSLPMPEVEKKLGSSPDGLTQAEAQKRLTQYGPNELTEKKTNLFLKFLSYSPARPYPPGLFAAVLLAVALALSLWSHRRQEHVDSQFDRLQPRPRASYRAKYRKKIVAPVRRQLVCRPKDLPRLSCPRQSPAGASSGGRPYRRPQNTSGFGTSGIGGFRLRRNCGRVYGRHPGPRGVLDHHRRRQNDPVRNLGRGQ